MTVSSLVAVADAAFQMTQAAVLPAEKKTGLVADRPATVTTMLPDEAAPQEVAVAVPEPKSSLDSAVPPVPKVVVLVCTTLAPKPAVPVKLVEPVTDAQPLRRTDALNVAGAEMFMHPLIVDEPEMLAEPLRDSEPLMPTVSVKLVQPEIAAEPLRPIEPLTVNVPLCVVQPLIVAEPLRLTDALKVTGAEMFMQPEMVDEPEIFALPERDSEPVIATVSEKTVQPDSVDEPLMLIEPVTIISSLTVIVHVLMPPVALSSLRILELAILAS